MSANDDNVHKFGLIIDTLVNCLNDIENKIDNTESNETKDMIKEYGSFTSATDEEVIKKEYNKMYDQMNKVIIKKKEEIKELDEKTKCLTGLVNVDKIKAIINKKKRNVNMLMDYLNKITDHVNSTLTEIYKSLRFDFCFRKYLLYDIQDQNDQFSKHSNCGFIDRPILYSNPFSSSSTTSKHNQPLNDLLNYVNENDQQQTTNSQLNSLIAENNSNPFQQNPLLNIKNEHFQPQLTTQSNSVQKELFQQLTQKQNSQIKQHIVISKPIIQSMSLNQKQKQQPNIQQLSQHQNYDQKPLQNQRIIVCKPIIPSMILQRNTLQQPNKLQQQLNPTQQQQPNSTQQQQPNSTQQQPNSTQQQLNSTLDIQNLPFGRFKENFELQNMTQFKDMINVFQKSKLKPNRRQKK